VSAIVLGPAALNHLPSLTTPQRVAIGMLVRAFDSPNAQTVSDAMVAIEAVVGTDTFGLALMSATTRILAASAPETASRPRQRRAT